MFSVLNIFSWRSVQKVSYTQPHDSQWIYYVTLFQDKYDIEID